MRSSIFTAVLFTIGACADPSFSAESHQNLASRINVVDFLPDDFVSDGTRSYQADLQRAIDAVPDSGGEVVFAPVTYLISDPTGLQIRSNLTLQMDGAIFALSERCNADGQVFRGKDVKGVRFFGGSIEGRNDAWPDGINIRGIHLVGQCENIHIRDLKASNLSSNGIGVFSSGEDKPSTNIRVIDCTVVHCSNKYGDYRAEKNRGPEKGSVREDQGLIAMYHVHDFSVRGCQFIDSRSDGTHFYFCRRGQFSDNRVARAKMGGYFLESCEHILAANNVIHDNGSRGVTIERGSQYCTLNGNTITGSGREGLWIPDSSNCNITGNVFSLNGRKPNGDTLNTIWNANITINQARGDLFNTPTSNYLIANNVIETDQSQVAAIRIDTRTETENIAVHGNLFVGKNRRVLVEGPDQQAVNIGSNAGELTQRVARDESSPGLSDR